MKKFLELSIYTVILGAYTGCSPLTPSYSYEEENARPMTQSVQVSLAGLKLAAKNSYEVEASLFSGRGSEQAAPEKQAAFSVELGPDTASFEVSFASVLPGVKTLVVWLKGAGITAKGQGILTVRPGQGALLEQPIVLERTEQQVVGSAFELTMAVGSGKSAAQLRGPMLEVLQNQCSGCHAGLGSDPVTFDGYNTEREVVEASFKSMKGIDGFLLMPFGAEEPVDQSLIDPLKSWLEPASSSPLHEILEIGSASLRRFVDGKWSKWLPMTVEDSEAQSETLDWNAGQTYQIEFRITEQDGVEIYRSEEAIKVVISELKAPRYELVLSDLRTDIAIKINQPSAL